MVCLLCECEGGGVFPLGDGFAVSIRILGTALTFREGEMPGAEVEDGEKGGEAFVEVDPTGRYGRYGEVLGRGAAKRVYRAFDQEEGIEVAWNQVAVGAEGEPHSGNMERLFSEVRLLRALHNDSIIALYSAWWDPSRATLNFITDAEAVSPEAPPRFPEGPEELGAADPGGVVLLARPQGLVNGNTGVVKIGDLGLAAILGSDHAAHTVIGTPELYVYVEHYNELVDVYSFGMCMLEMVTLHIPYAECCDVTLHKKVTSGIRPAALQKVTDPDVRGLAPRQVRPSAAHLLMDPPNLLVGFSNEEFEGGRGSPSGLARYHEQDCVRAWPCFDAFSVCA